MCCDPCASCPRRCRPRRCRGSRSAACSPPTRVLPSSWTSAATSWSDTSKTFCATHSVRTAWSCCRGSAACPRCATMRKSPNVRCAGGWDPCRGCAVGWLTHVGWMRCTPCRPHPTDRGVIHLSKVLDFVHTGDIVLFRCRNMLSGLQRRVTRSEFDHVGVVVSHRGVCAVPGQPRASALVRPC